jgi:hypothetical protein
MKHELIDWVFTVMTDLENILKDDKLSDTAEALQDTRFILLSELSRRQKHAAQKCL